MSSFRQTVTQMTDQENLVKTLTDLGYKPTVSETKRTVRGHGSETRTAEVIITKEELKDGGDIGFAKDKDGNFAVVMDSYVLRNTNHTELVKSIKMKYTENMTRKVTKANGWTLLGSRETTDKNGKRITRMQYAVA
jgi:Protein of unknown function (DUF1257)